MQAVTSTMASGERKWALSTRRGGMTVLGKVAVPKPINLPSQKLENHGMDPNVEIVPKGTLSWGSHSSSPALNAWGSSSLSLTADNGRPSSGGNGTRPSTGGSEKANESTTNAWGSNSRPSSASGSLASSQASGTTIRPHSADTRPGSSQLSRFAEPSNENSGAHSKNGSFSLASGDFPTLGSEKEDAPKNDHSSPQGDNVVADTGINSNIMNHSRWDSPTYEDGRRPNKEKWQGDVLQRNPIMPSPTQHFASCHGPPVGSPPVGVWFRGPPGAPHYIPPGGPPYGPPGAPPYGSSGITAYGRLIGPGGFPVEHPYYHTPIPTPHLGNSQPGPHHGAGPRGLHSNNGEMYRPHMPDGHFRPGMLMKPGFFPGPVPYEGYHPTPMGYCGPNEQDIPYLGPAGGPAVYDRHLRPNAPDLVNSQSASGGHDSNVKPSGPEQVASGHRHNHHEQYKVLLKQQGDVHECRDSVASNDSQTEKGHLRRPSCQEEDHIVGSYNNETVLGFRPRRTPGSEGGPVVGSHTQGHGGSQFYARERLTEEGRNTKGVSSAEKNLQDKVASSGVGVPPKDSSLIMKVEGLNAKARPTDGKQDAALDSSWDEGKGRPHMISKAPHSTFPANYASVAHFKNHGGDIINPPIFNVGEAAAGSVSSRKVSNSGPRIRTECHNKGKSEFLETEGRHKRPHTGHFSTVVSSSKSEPASHEEPYQRSTMGTGKPESSLEGIDLVSDPASMADLIDIEAQKAKKREIAKQRAIQLQREEEERIKEQKAKAQAKLEELNRRTKLMGSSTGQGEMVTEISEMGSSGETGHKVEEAQPEQPVSVVVALKSAPSSEINSLKPDSVYIGTRTLGPPLQIPMDDLQGSVMSPAEHEGDHNIDARAEPQHNGGKNHASKSKTKGYYKEKQNFQLEKVASEKSVKASGDALKHGSETVVEVNKNVIVPAELLVPQRSRSNKSGKNWHKVEDKSALVGIQSVAPKNADAIKAPSDSGKPRSPKMDEPTHIQPPDSSCDWTLPSEPHASHLKEETQSRINNQSRYQSSRKQLKNPQSNRTVDKSHGTDTVVWAPVRQPNKEITEGSCSKVVCEEAGDHIGNIDHVQSNLRNKRAEIERYVPKPVAKELAQQESSQLPTPPSVDLMGSSATKVETAVENRIGDGNYNRKAQARAPGALRQRVSVGIPRGQGSEDGSLVHSVVGKDIHISAVQDHAIRPDHETSEQTISSDGWNSPNDWNTNTCKAPDAYIPGSRDQGSFNRGKRHYVKGNRNTGTYAHEHSKGQTGKEMDIGLSHITVSNNDEQDRTAMHKESRPSRVGGAGQKFGGETSRFVKKEPVPPGDHIQLKDVKATDGVSNVAFAPAKNMGPLTKVGPQHEKRERKVAMPLVGAYSANINSHAQVDQPPPVEHQQERPHSSSDTRKNVNRNFKGKDSQWEWNSFERDRRYHNQASGRGRPRHDSSHYEYKPKAQFHSAGPDGGSPH